MIKKNKKNKFLKYIYIIFWLFSFISFPLLFILIGGGVIIVIIAIILAIFSWIRIPFYYNITKTIYDIPVTIVNKKVKLEKNKDINYIKKEIKNKKNYYNIIKTYYNENYEKYNWIFKTNNEILKKIKENWIKINESINYISNLKFYEQLWKNQFLKNLDLPLLLLKDIKVKIEDWKTIYLWNKDISFYYDLKQWKFNNNSPFYIRVWNKIINYYKKYDSYKCIDNNYNKLNNKDKFLYCYNKLPKINLYTNIILKNKIKYWTLYDKIPIAIEWFWIKIEKKYNKKEKKYEKELVFYLKPYKWIRNNYFINLKQYITNFNKYFNYYTLKDNSIKYENKKYFKYIKEIINKWNINYYLNSKKEFTLDNPYIIVNNNEIDLNFQIQLVSLSSFLWNIRNNDWSKKLIYDVNMKNNNITWTWNNLNNNIIDSKTFNNNDYNNDNLIIKDKYNYLNKKYLSEKYINNLKLFFKNFTNNSNNSDIIKTIKNIRTWKNIDDNLTFLYYLYYVYNKYKKYLNDNNINLYTVSTNNNIYNNNWPFVFWDDTKEYLNNITSKELLNNFCYIIELGKNKNNYYSQFLNKWKIYDWTLNKIYYNLTSYCKNNKENIKYNSIVKQYKPLFKNNLETHNLLKWFVFWPLEIKYLINNWVILSNNNIKGNNLKQFWYDIMKQSFILKFIEYFEYINNNNNNNNNIKISIKNGWNDNWKEQIDKFYKNLLNNWNNNLWNKSIYIDLWFEQSLIDKILFYFWSNYETEWFRRYLNSLYSYIGYYQIKNDIKKITSWKRNALEYLMYYENTDWTPFQILDFTDLEKLLFWNKNNNSFNNITVNISDYPYIVETIIKDIYNKEWFTFKYIKISDIKDNNSSNIKNFITVDDNLKNIQKYNYCDYLKNKFDTEKDYLECKEFSYDSYIYLLLKEKNDIDKLNKYSYKFYNKWFKKYKLFSWFWNKKWLFPYWKQATLNKKISNWRYPWQCVHYIVINVNKKKLYGWNAVNWCKAAEWKKWFEVIYNSNEAVKQVWPWDIIVWDHLINWKSNWVWHIAMVSNVERTNNWTLKKVWVQEFNAWCWNWMLWSKYIRDLFNSNWIDSSKYYLKWCIFYYNIKNIDNYNLTRWKWGNNIMPLKCIIKIKNFKDYNNLWEIFK